ncbi:ABC transporter permease [Myceligenerans halotolerans]
MTSTVPAPGATAPSPVPRSAGGRRNATPRRLRDGALGIAGVVAVVAVEEALTRTGIIDPTYLPPVTVMFGALAEQLGQAPFWSALAGTLSGWAIGLALAMVLGTVCGIVIGSLAVVRELTASTIEFLRPIPSVALIPLVVLLFGTQPESSISLVVYAAFWQVLVQVLYGVTDVDPVARDTARSYRFSRMRVARSVIWPTALPYVVTGFRLAASVALILEITAELVIGVPGLGREIGVAQSSGAVPKTYALVIVVGLIGVAVNLFARAVEARVLAWHPSVRTAA